MEAGRAKMTPLMACNEEGPLVFMCLCGVSASLVISGHVPTIYPYCL